MRLAAAGSNGASQTTRWYQDIDKARLRMRELEDRQALLWKRLFEMEEDFPAPLEEAKTLPGIPPW